MQDNKLRIIFKRRRLNLAFQSTAYPAVLWKCTAQHFKFLSVLVPWSLSLVSCVSQVNIFKISYLAGECLGAWQLLTTVMDKESMLKSVIKKMPRRKIKLWLGLLCIFSFLLFSASLSHDASLFHSFPTWLAVCTSKAMWSSAMMATASSVLLETGSQYLTLRSNSLHFWLWCPQSFILCSWNIPIFYPATNLKHCQLRAGKTSQQWLWPRMVAFSWLSMKVCLCTLPTSFGSVSLSYNAEHLFH